VLTHHLRMLEAHGLLHTVRRGRQRHLFTRAPERPGAGLPDAAGRILQLLRQGVRTQREIAERAQLSQQAVSYHLRRLRALGVVRRDAGSAHGSYVAAAPA
jgi:DNA-binding transcriptional ArsR family regulator